MMLDKLTEDWGDNYPKPEDEPEPLPPDEPKTTATPELPFDAYYDSDRKEYLIQNGRNCWLPQNAGQFNRRLKNAGIEERRNREKIVEAIEDGFDVRYAAPLAGRAAGFFEENGIRFLVTESPKLLDPVAGDWRNLRAVLEGLFLNNEPDHGQRQLDTLYGWLKASIEALRSGRHQDAQALAIAGQRDCGKSLLQHLFTDMLGGRSAKGARYMMGRTEFNAELFEAEHIMLEDEFMSHAISDRLKLGTAIKNFTVSTQVQSCHRKNHTPVNLSPWWRVTITLNDDAEALQVLPPMDDHIEDKIILLRASRFDMPMPTHTTELRERFGKQLRSEIPPFIYWLLHEYEIPAPLQDRRFVIATWHHPDMRAELAALSPETQLLTLIDEALWNLPTDLMWEGKASELRRELLNNDRTRTDAQKLLGWTNSTGTYLGRLAKDLPTRVQPHRTEDERLWRIARP